MEPKDVVRAAWRQRWLVLVVFALTAVALAAFLLLAPRSYTATATVSATQNPSAGPDVARGDLDALRRTMARLADSPAVADAVQGELSRPRTVDDLQRHLEGAWIRGTVLIEVRATDADPDVAAEMANLAAVQLPLVTPSSDSFSFTTTSTARPPVTSSRPDVVRAGSIALGSAVLLSCLGAVVRERRRPRPDALLDDAADAPLLGSMAAPHDLRALPTLDPGTSAAEDFRRLRLALDDGRGGRPDVLVVAGVDEGELNVWLGANLAVSLAQSGRRVLLVDGRLDDRSVQPDTGPRRAGLVDVLGGRPWEEALVDGPVDGLRVLAAGHAEAGSGEALVRRGWDDALAAARRLADVVVVLAPSIDRSDDARLMAARGSLLVAVPEGAVSPAALRAHTTRLRDAGTRLLGLVLVRHRGEGAGQVAA